MSSFIRKQIASYLQDAIIKSPSPVTADGYKTNCSKLPWCIRFQRVGKRSKGRQPQLLASYLNLRRIGLVQETNFQQTSSWAQTLCSQLPGHPVIQRVEAQQYGLTFDVDIQTLIKSSLTQIIEDQQNVGFNSDLHDYTLTDDQTIKTPHGQKIIVEYSSPNIAKPFHAGHLRSTVIGNVIANLLQKLGHDVVRINYLGNWGTQFGLLGVGYQRYGSEEELQKDALQHLFEVYVKINKEAATDDNIKNEARSFFTKMTQGDEDALRLYQICMAKSTEEYTAMYKRLGVTFDEYHGESMYVQQAQDLLDRLAESGVLQKDSSGVGFVDLTSSEEELKNKLQANLMRSDGVELYLTRDLAAAIDRYEKYKFDRLLYVVESSQHSHFDKLIKLLRKLGHKWSENPLSDFHVRFGRVNGMSTRKGEVAFLKHILEEAKERMLTTMKNTETTKVQGVSDVDYAADILASSAIIVQDLKEHRLKSYQFSWDRMMDFKGDTGVFLQYTHAKLHNLEKNCGVELNTDCDLDTLVEDSAINLVLHLASYDEAIHRAVTELEPCYIVRYLFALSRLVQVVGQNLYVKDQPLPVAQARLLLFHCARIVLASGLRTLGIEPLDAM